MTTLLILALIIASFLYFFSRRKSDSAPENIQNAKSEFFEHAGKIKETVEAEVEKEIETQVTEELEKLSNIESVDKTKPFANLVGNNIVTTESDASISNIPAKSKKKSTYKPKKKASDSDKGSKPA